GLAHVRLSVIDVAGGAQPMANEDGDVRVIYNGEIYNYLELRHELQLRGHVFRTRSDTEVLVHGYEQWGEGLLERLNGQFAFALHDRRTASLFLARDRFGILPLYYAERGGDLYFASEIKALLASGEGERALDPAGLDEVFTIWAARPPRTPFRGIRALEPGCWARWREGTLSIRRHYTREQGIKVILTGEGSDEVFLGYDLFKETLVRLFCLRQPDSQWRPRLFDRLYWYLAPQARKGDFWRRFFLSAGSPDDPLFSHLPRFRLTARIRDFYADGFRASAGAFDALAELREALPPGFMRW